MLLRYCRSDFEMVPVAPIITGITFAFSSHMRRISIVRSLYTYTYVEIFSDFCLITFLSQELQHLLTCIFLFYFHGI